MTVSSSSNYEFDIDSIVTMGFRQAGLSNPYETLAEERKMHGRAVLEMALKSLATSGLFAKTIGFEYVTLAADTYKYTMPNTVLNAVDVAKYILPSETDYTQPSTEFPVTPINHLQWQDLVTRSLAAQPLNYYANRSGALVEVWLWPKPSATEAGGHVRFKVERLRANALAGADTPDAESFWELALTYTLAYHLAFSSGLPAERVRLLKAEAAEQVENCKGKAKEHPVMQPEFQLVNRWR